MANSWNSLFSDALERHLNVMEALRSQFDKVDLAAEAWIKALQNGNKVLWLGNGGSAADAQHMAAELMVRYAKNRQPLPSIALSTDSSILTAHSNDFEFETIFSRQIDALAQSGDVVMALSTSGNSANVVKAAEAAKQKGCVVVGMTGQKPSALSAVADICFQIDSTETARIQEAHSFISHLLCQVLDEVFTD